MTTHATSRLRSFAPQPSREIRRPPCKVHWDEHGYELDVEDLDGNVLVFWGNMPAAR